MDVVVVAEGVDVVDGLSHKDVREADVVAPVEHTYGYEVDAVAVGECGLEQRVVVGVEVDGRFA